MAVSGPQSCRLAGEHADLTVPVEPDSSPGEQFDAAEGAGTPRTGQMRISYDTDAVLEAAREYADAG